MHYAAEDEFCFLLETPKNKLIEAEFVPPQIIRGQKR